MQSHPHRRAQVIAALRARSADCFIIRPPRTGSRSVPRDTKPLQRTLSRSQDTETPDNANMCSALWQLMTLR